MSGPIIPYGRQSIDDADVAAVERVLRGDWLTQGPAIEEFEQGLCAALDSPAAVAVNSGTAALHVGMLALGIGEGDLVIVPPITFAASGNAARYCGAEVAFVDVEPDTALIDADALDRFLGSYTGPLRPRAAVAVHYAGLPADLIRLAQVCTAHGIELIEDACHALGATWLDARGEWQTVGAGTASAFSAFSFHPVKHLTTGEGGALLTRRQDVAEGARLYRSHGITRDPSRLEANEGPWWYEMQALGFNYRMPDLLAALGTSQLAKQERWLARRRAIAKRYREAFSDHSGIGLQAERAGREHAYHLFPILVENRREALATLHGAGIRAQVHYIPMHRFPYYTKRYGVQQFPRAEAWYRRELSIPMFPAMTDAEVDIVIENVLALDA